MTSRRFGFALAFAAAAFATGCAHLTYPSGPTVPTTPTAPAFPVVPVPSPSPTSTGTSATVPQTCATQAPGATIVAMGSAISATSAAPFGTISGYAVASSFATLVNVAAPVAVRVSDIVQFVNVESGSPTAIYHSAVGFPGATAFPAVPVVFPPSLNQAVGTTIGANAWSTGVVAPQCFSPAFTLDVGTYYFGDLAYFNLTNFRDVILVTR